MVSATHMLGIQVSDQDETRALKHTWCGCSTPFGNRTYLQALMLASNTQTHTERVERVGGERERMWVRTTTRNSQLFLRYPYQR
jgi:hypothetical protein